MKKHSLLNLPISAVSLRMFMRVLWLCAGLIGVMELAACVYKLDIQQGNILEREKVAQLKTGMTKRQVRYILGTPLVIDTFNQDRWDYFYSLKDYTPENHEGNFHQERLTLYFDKGLLSKIDNQLSAEITQPVADPDQLKPTQQKQEREKVMEPEPVDSNQ